MRLVPYNIRTNSDTTEKMIPYSLIYNYYVTFYIYEPPASIECIRVKLSLNISTKTQTPKNQKDT